MKFIDLGLDPRILEGIDAMGYENATPVQQQVMVPILEGKDIIAAAQTGTGKTAAFSIPILQLLSNQIRHSKNPRALILTPTRELAAQIGESVTTYGKYMQMRSTVVFGGVIINPQMKKLRPGVDVLVATPGRLLDLFSQNAVKFNQVEVLVLDEADRMLSLDFEQELNELLQVIPEERKTLLFSATMTSKVQNGLTPWKH